jgi:hypothetical protein
MMVEICGFALMAVLTMLRMTVLKDSSIYSVPRRIERGGNGALISALSPL